MEFYWTLKFLKGDPCFRMNAEPRLTYFTRVPIAVLCKKEATFKNIVTKHIYERSVSPVSDVVRLKPAFLLSELLSAPTEGSYSGT